MQPRCAFTGLTWRKAIESEALLKFTVINSNHRDKIKNPGQSLLKLTYRKQVGKYQKGKIQIQC